MKQNSEFVSSFTFNIQNSVILPTTPVISRKSPRPVLINLALMRFSSVLGRESDFSHSNCRKWEFEARNLYKYNQSTGRPRNLKFLSPVSCARCVGYFFVCLWASKKKNSLHWISFARIYRHVFVQGTQNVYQAKLQRSNEFFTVNNKRLQTWTKQYKTCKRAEVIAIIIVMMAIHHHYHRQPNLPYTKRLQSKPSTTDRSIGSIV